MRSAVIGLGRMGAEPSSRLEGKVPAGWLPISHLEAIQSICDLTLEAICDLNESRMGEIAEIYEVDKKFTNYKELLDQEKIDFLCIATRTGERSEIISYAISKGTKYIYFEKPVSRSISECDSIIELARQNNVVLGYGVNRRYNDVYRFAKDFIKSGELGKLMQITIEAGRSNLLWSHPHSTDLILFFADSVDLEYIQGTCSFQDGYLPENNSYIDDDPIIENAYYLFKNGIQAGINLTGGFNVRLGCSKGILTIYGDGSYIEIKSGSGYFTNHKIIDFIPRSSATINAFRDMVYSKNDTARLPITPEEIRIGLLMLIGTLQSSLYGGKRISVDQVNHELIVTGRSGNSYA
ncbi:Gfo/Idh/MocA family protein [Leptospira soteropolitanensis]|uniref:Gfo/Idh/MocA family oxidoreductase n=1 Tax=Leptospira soteropolitanensis TaxID=2950025 RepID=A0AAW5VDZ7_9LEPT|nr:Gfo/Idh/MocA family oxidoreductase [Leptospira soteropolitanensis]MCW7493152.1 Gfo/Idh/MocA family oxidoreductase [Leptospira soteropolitanensis]MCW7500779.1 Gfo/Idh/MocA family oxidoreductase [Leptospira soteropolitanensis]MCW7523002.1 Gfo/Idh/MocA family oxidoreductase [Leptospira soteropolitanensis]MCW7530720.1 Gfo/Idh/MocA family oxidoreductase [Leptospira soteropolitanensis]